MRNLDHAYDQFLSANEKEAIRAIGDFEGRLEQSHVKFGRFTIPTFFKPHFVTDRQEKLLKGVTEKVIGILNKVIELYFTESEVRSLFQFSDPAKELIEIDPGYKSKILVARLDCFLEGQSLKFMEFNTDSPAGMAYADAIEEILCQSDEFQKFFEAHHLKREKRLEKLLQAFFETYGEFGGSESKPQIAIVDWRTVKTRPEFEVIKTYFEEQGCPTVIADPRDLRYRQGKLYCDDFRIDLLYRRAIFGELLEKLDEVRDMIRAVKERATCMINSFQSLLGGSKALLSFLTNRGFDRFFTEEENKIKYEHIPWTRTILDTEKFYGGKKIYLINFLKDEKENLVLKPSVGYGGKDVFIGCETPNEDWNRAIDRALKGDWVIQEFVSIPIVTVPTVINGKLDFLYKKMNFNLFAFRGRYAGGFARVSDESVINVAKSGGLIPSITAEEIHER